MFIFHEAADIIGLFHAGLRHTYMFQHYHCAGERECHSRFIAFYHARGACCTLECCALIFISPPRREYFIYFSICLASFFDDARHGEYEY